MYNLFGRYILAINPFRCFRGLIWLRDLRVSIGKHPTAGDLTDSDISQCHRVNRDIGENSFSSNDFVMLSTCILPRSRSALDYQSRDQSIGSRKAVPD